MCVCIPIVLQIVIFICTHIRYIILFNMHMHARVYISKLNNIEIFWNHVKQDKKKYYSHQNVCQITTLLLVFTWPFWKKVIHFPFNTPIFLHGTHFSKQHIQTKQMYCPHLSLHHQQTSSLITQETYKWTSLMVTSI